MLSTILLYTINLGTLRGDIWFAVFLYVAVFIFAATKGKLGDSRSAIIFTIVIMILVFYQHPQFVWLALGIYLFQQYGKEIFKV